MALGVVLRSFRAVVRLNGCGGLMGVALAAGCCVTRAPVPRGPPTETGAVPPGDLLADGSVNRRPDGVALEPVPALPIAVQRADARGVVALRAPLARDAIVAIVLALADGWRHESPEELGDLLTADAGPIDGRSRGRAALMDGWRQRLRTHEFSRLAGTELVRPERIERYDWSDLSVPGALLRPVEMRPDELYVRVPLEVTRVAGERVFGDVIVLLLKREANRYKIAAYGEVDAR
ncbi:MAG: hypothetical protein M3O50_02985 [Myxococcota bacterium]|nr:hypothetical protein [Myxococcota bacterium]